MSDNLHFDLSHFSVIQISGNDATEFLQNQLITNLSDLEHAGWLLSGWCLPNGRLLANFILFENQDSFFLILPSMLKEKIIKRLTMFVLRSKVSIEDVSDKYALIGLAGENSNNLLNQIDSTFTPTKKQNLKSSIVLQMPDETPRWFMIIKIDELKSIMNQILLAFKESDRASWSLLDIQASLPWITVTTSEQFIPQMLNLDQTGGLSYEKGCYPGQEIIARLHYRGEVKKRLFIGEGESEITPGPADQIENTESKKLVGDIIDAETVDGKRFQFLAVVELNASENVQIRGEEKIAVSVQTLADS